MFGIAVIPSILLALGMAISPESPRWLVQVFFATLFSLLLLRQYVFRWMKPFCKSSSAKLATFRAIDDLSKILFL